MKRNFIHHVKPALGSDAKDERCQFLSLQVSRGKQTPFCCKNVQNKPKQQPTMDTAASLGHAQDEGWKQVITATMSGSNFIDNRMGINTILLVKLRIQPNAI